MADHHSADYRPPREQYAQRLDRRRRHRIRAGLRLGGQALMASQGAARLTLGPQQPSALPLPAALFLRFTLVVQLLAARERKLELGAALLVEIKLERYQRHALALDGAYKPVDLAAVKQ